MANVLSELFGKIAEAIRDMNPNAGTMKPAEFPEKILDIPSGAGDSDAPSGPALRMATGEFSPDTAETVLSVSGQPFMQHPTYADYYYWEESPAAFTLTEDTTYAVNFSGVYRNLVAEKRSLVGGVKDCIALGNTDLLTGGDGESFLILYSETDNKTVVFSKYRSPENIVGIIHPTPTKVTIEHGLGAVPDFVLVYYNSVDLIGNNVGYPTQTTAVWGLKSTFSEYSDILSAYSGYGVSGKKSTYGLDNMDYSGRNSGYIYCDDDNTFTLGDVSDDMVNGNLMANQTYRWIAMTGLGGYVAGGSSADVRYVTFMNHDGTVTYGKIPVAVGYDCPIPKFNTPTRESDVQYNYTFYGWANEANGGADENWNKSITEDKTVYANFAATLRTYTITYYDGDSILKTDHLPYGAMPSYIPEKKGYNFEGWEPAFTTVTEDASYYSQWSEKLKFSGASWADIAEVSASGKAAETFNIGDERVIPITYADGTIANMTVRIAGFNHDDLADGSGKAGISIVCKTIPDYNTIWGESNYNMYNTSLVAKALGENGDIWSMLPSELTSVIKPVAKKYDASVQSGANPTIGTMNASLWILSIDEIGMTGGSPSNTPGSSYCSKLGNKYELFPTITNTNETTTQFQYFEPIAPQDNAKTAYTWLRTILRGGILKPKYANAYTDIILNKPYYGYTDTTDYGYKTNEYGIWFGFCI